MLDFKDTAPRHYVLGSDAHRWLGSRRLHLSELVQHPNKVWQGKLEELHDKVDHRMKNS